MSEALEVVREGAAEFGKFLVAAMPELYELFKRSGGDAKKAIAALKAAYTAEEAKVDVALDAKHEAWRSADRSGSVVLDAPGRRIIDRVTSAWAKRR